MGARGVALQVLLLGKTWLINGPAPSAREYAQWLALLTIKHAMPAVATTMVAEPAAVAGATTRVV